MITYSILTLTTKTPPKTHNGEKHHEKSMMRAKHVKGTSIERALLCILRSSKLRNKIQALVAVRCWGFHHAIST